MRKIILENVVVSEDKENLSYTFENGDVLEAKIKWGTTNHFGEEVEVFDYIELVENSFDIENAEAYIEIIYDYLQDTLQFR